MRRLGVYWSVSHRRPEDYAYFKALQPTVFKLMDAGRPDYDWAQANLPNSLIVARDWAMSEQKDDMRRDPVGTGRRHAEEWHGHQARLGFDPARTLILGINEPSIWEAGIADALRLYTIALCDRAAELNLRVGAMQLSVGWPGNNGPDMPPNWSPFAGVEDAIRRGNHALVVHEYWADSGPGENWGWWAGRSLKCPWRVPIVIGECGVDMFVKTASVSHNSRGWQGRMHANRYAAELAEYTVRMSADPRFVGCCVFASDFANREWFSFDVEPAYDAILVASVPQVAKAETYTLHLPAVNPQPATTIQMYVDSPDGLKIRAAPSMNAPQLGGLEHGASVTVHEVTDGEQPWARVDGGWVAAWLLSKTKPAPAVGPGPVEPTPPPATGIIDPLAGQAIIQIESGGQGFGPGNRLLIRFENHLFNRQTGNAHAQLFRQGDPPWTGHQWRRNTSEAWQDVHTGNQANEWAAFDYASILNRHAALQSISMGAAQILGSHYRRLGYSSAEAMFRAFGDRQYGMAAQVLGFVNFFLSDARLFEAMRNKDFLTVATIYNGPGQAQHYANLMRQAYERLKSI